MEDFMFDEIVPDILDPHLGKVRYDKWFQSYELFDFAKFPKSQINHNFGTICHTEIYLTFFRW